MKTLGWSWEPSDEVGIGQETLASLVAAICVISHEVD